MKNTLSLLLLSVFFLFSCKNEKPTTDNNTTVESSDDSTPSEKQYTLTPFDPSQSYDGAGIEDMSYVNGLFNFTLSESEYELGAQTPDADQKMCANSGKGQHIHLIVDNEPYAAKYTSEFDYEIKDGEHYLLAFLSRSYHESIKTDEAHVAKKITVENNSITNAEPIDQPAIFYSRPKGTYVGKDTEKVMLDFYPINASIGTDYKIIAMINGEEHMIDTWQPYYITGLPMGENTIELVLVDSNNNKVDSPLNMVSRTFTLRDDATAE